MKLKNLLVTGLAVYGGVQLAEKWAAANRKMIKKKVEDAAIGFARFIFSEPDKKAEIELEACGPNIKLNIGDAYYVRKIYENDRFDDYLIDTCDTYIEVEE